MSQNGQTHFKNLAVNAARFLKCVSPFWGIMHYRVNPITQLWVNWALKEMRNSYFCVTPQN